MKPTILFAVLGLAAFGAGAQEVGRVISSTPVIQQVAVPRTYCNQPQVIAQPPTSGAGGLMGAIAGAGLGSQIGSGSGTAAAMMIGAIGGALLGNNIESGGAAHAYAQPACATETTYENRTAGYRVTYEYAGREYTVQMPYDPGPTIQLQVTPVTSVLPPPQASAPVIAPPVAAAPVYVQPAPIIYQTVPAAPVYPVYAPYPVYRPHFPIGISLGYHWHRWRR